MKFRFFQLNIVNLNFIYSITWNVSLQLDMLLYWLCFCGVSVTLCDVSVTLSNWTLDVHPRSDSTEFAEALPIVASHADVHHESASISMFSGRLSFWLKKHSTF